MTNPDNVGGMPEFVAVGEFVGYGRVTGEPHVRMSSGLRQGVRLFTEDQMREAIELCRAAPAGGELERGKIDPSWSLFDRVDFALRDAGFDLDEASNIAALASGGAPAGSGEVLDSWQKWPIINRLQMQANDCEDAADEQSDAIITALQLKAMAADLREAAALLRKLQQESR